MTDNPLELILFWDIYSLVKADQSSGGGCSARFSGRISDTIPPSFEERTFSSWETKRNHTSLGPQSGPMEMGGTALAFSKAAVNFSVLRPSPEGR